jgi:hypothetical protein
MFRSPGHIRYLVSAVCLMLPYFLQAQIPPEPGPTSATDADVKIHGQKRIYQKDKQVKVASGSRFSEHQGQPIRKPKATRPPDPTKSEARVFKRHNHTAKKAKSHPTSRQYKKQSITRRDKSMRKKIKNISNAGAI